MLKTRALRFSFEGAKQRIGTFIIEHPRLIAVASFVGISISLASVFRVGVFEQAWAIPPPTCAACTPEERLENLAENVLPKEHFPIDKFPIDKVPDDVPGK